MEGAWKIIFVWVDEAPATTGGSVAAMTGTPPPSGPRAFRPWPRRGAPVPRGRQVAALGMVLGGGVSVQFGAAVAVLLFPRAGIAGTVTLRLVVAAGLLLAACRPRLAGHPRRDLGLVVAFGAALAGMNTLIYLAIDRIPLGPAVTLEVLGPLALSVVAARRAASWLWAVLALVGVVLLSGGGFDRLDPVGAGFALASGVMWALYIVCSARVGRRFPRADGLALAMTVAAAAITPVGVVSAGADLLDPVTLGLGAAVALLSSVLPYTLELLALRRMPTGTFAVLMSLGPALATLAGYLVLGQTLTATELVAIGLVVVACAGAVRTGGGSSAAPRPRRRRVADARTDAEAVLTPPSRGDDR